VESPKLEVADIFRRYGEAYRQQFGASLSTAQRRIMTAIEVCRTAALGGHVEVCDRCGHQRIFFNSCSDRHCPKCQSLARAQWIENRQSELLDVPYFHVVFTVPEQIADIAFQNKRTAYDILFRATAETLTTIAADPQHLGAEIGFFAVLHTWGQTLLFHPHLHCVVPGGGLSPDGKTWISCRPRFFLPVDVLSCRFRRLFLKYLLGEQNLTDGSNLNFVFGGLLVICLLRKESRRRRCGNGGKAGAVFAKAFPNSLWESSKRSRRRPPLSISTAVAVSTALSAARFLFCALCCKKKKAPGCSLEPKTRVINRLCSGANQ
jgi:hypothetical protein